MTTSVGSINQLETWDNATASLPAKRRGRPKGSKNKPVNEGAEPALLITYAPAEPLPTPRSSKWIRVHLTSTFVEEGLPMVISRYEITGVSKLPSGGASVVVDVGHQPMILTTVTRYEDVVAQLEDGNDW